MHLAAKTLLFPYSFFIYFFIPGGWLPLYVIPVDRLVRHWLHQYSINPLFGGNYSGGGNQSDLDVHRSRLNLFKDICISWANGDEFSIVRLGLFIYSLINMFVLSLVSMLTRKSIERTLHTLSTIGIEPTDESNAEANQDSTSLPSRQDVLINIGTSRMTKI